MLTQMTPLMTNFRQLEETKAKHGTALIKFIAFQVFARVCPWSRLGADTREWSSGVTQTSSRTQPVCGYILTRLLSPVGLQHRPRITFASSVVGVVYRHGTAVFA